MIVFDLYFSMSYGVYDEFKFANQLSIPNMIPLQNSLCNQIDTRYGITRASSPTGKVAFSLIWLFYVLMVIYLNFNSCFAFRRLFLSDLYEGISRNLLRTLYNLRVVFIFYLISAGSKCALSWRQTRRLASSMMIHRSI